MVTSFKWDDGEIQRGIKRLDSQTDRAVKALTEFHATRGEGYMKSTAPWTDRTGAARSGLFTITEFPGASYIIVFAHTVHYGIWLEIANSGNYQVIMPSVRKIGNDLMRDLHKLFRRLK